MNSRRLDRRGVVLFEEDYCLIPVLNGRDGTIVWTKVDPERAVWASNHNWYLKAGYPFSVIPHLGLRAMHRCLLPGSDRKQMMDHINRDKLDNRRTNLRFAYPYQNSRNASTQRRSKSGYKGVSKFKDGGWLVNITPRKNCKNRIREKYWDKDIAAFRYNELARKYHRKFAALNDHPWNHTPPADIPEPWWPGPPPLA